MKWFMDVIPFLASYPAWVKGLVSGWVLLTAVCIAALLLAQPRKAAEAGLSEKSNASTQGANGVWLKIKGVEIFSSDWRDAGVRVTAEINGNSFTYPNIGGAKWAMVGPDMSPGLFKLPPSDVLQITFSMEAKHQGKNDQAKFVSQRTVVLRKDQLPKSETYAVHQLGTEGFRSGPIAAEISFAISNQPD